MDIVNLLLDNIWYIFGYLIGANIIFGIFEEVLSRRNKSK